MSEKPNRLISRRAWPWPPPGQRPVESAQTHPTNVEEVSEVPIETPKETETPKVQVATIKVPEVVVIDISEQTYRNLVAQHLARQPAWARTFIGQFFDWIKIIHPADVATALAEKRRLKDMYNDAPFVFRTALLTVKGFLRINPAMKKRLREGVKPYIIKYILKFDNPAVYAVFMQYPEGDKMLDDWITDCLEVLGVEVEQTG